MVDAGTVDHGGPVGAAQVLQVLSALQWQGRSDLARLIQSLGERLRRRTLIVLISDLLCPSGDLARPLGGLCARGHEVAVLQVLDRSEVDLPAAWGLSQLSDPEGRSPGLTCDVAAAKEGFDRAMRAHLTACRKLMAACQGDHVLAITDADVADTLGGWLHRRRRRW
jgi:hypothetical protein